MIRAVLDTNTLVSAVINVISSVAAKIYQSCKEKRFLNITSSAILSELDEVLHRERIMKSHKLTALELEKIIDQMAKVSFVVSGKIKVDVSRDPSDNKVISAALEGKADYIVSRDQDLLDLKEYQDIKIITPEEFMGILRAKS